MRFLSEHNYSFGEPFMSRTIPFALCLNILLAAGLASAQQEQQHPPAPKPGPEHAHLNTLEGTWDALVTTSDGKKSKAEATYKMECAGLWIASDFKGEFEGKPFQGKGLDGYDPAKKKYVGVWVDSMITTPLFMEGSRDESSKTTTMTGECPGPDGKPMKMKAVTKEIDKDHMTFEMFMVGPDGKDTKAMTINSTRRKP
jgi:hypothetical protein